MLPLKLQHVQMHHRDHLFNSQSLRDNIIINKSVKQHIMHVNTKLPAMLTREWEIIHQTHAAECWFSLTRFSRW